jgi:hypothetical protein
MLVAVRWRSFCTNTNGTYSDIPLQFLQMDCDNQKPGPLLQSMRTPQVPYNIVYLLTPALLVRACVGARARARACNLMRTGAHTLLTSRLSTNYSSNCSQNCEKWLNFGMSVRPSARAEQLGSHWTDFHEILHLSVLRKTVQKMQGTLKSDKNNGYFTWRPLDSFRHISLSPS